MRLVDEALRKVVIWLFRTDDTHTCCVSRDIIKITCQTLGGELNYTCVCLRERGKLMKMQPVEIEANQCRAGF